MNRRGNGLSAEVYAPLADLAPHLADALLTVLGEAGVAAYVAPPSGPSDPAGRDETPAAGPADPGDPLDRLYVDVDMKPTAEGILRAHLARLRDTAARSREPESADRAEGADAAERGDTAEHLDGAKQRDTAEHMDTAERAGKSGRTERAERADTGRTGPSGEAARSAERDEDAIWAEIVAGFDAVPEGEAPWPDEEDIREPEEPREGEDRTGRLPRVRVIKSVDTPQPPRTPPADDDHYVPPPPPPLPSADPLTKAAWIALIGGPVYLLVTVILDWEVPGWAAFCAVAAFIGGFVTLVLRMGDEPRGPDDGAVV